HVGLVSAWVHETRPHDRVHLQPCAALPYLWHDGDIAPYTVVRAAALIEALRLPPAGPPAPTRRDLFDHIANAGWDAVTYPAVLGSLGLVRNGPATQRGDARYSAMARAVQRLHTPILQWLIGCSGDERRALVKEVMRRPVPSAMWFAARVVRSWRRP